LISCLERVSQRAPRALEGGPGGRNQVSGGEARKPIDRDKVSSAFKQMGFSIRSSEFLLHRLLLYWKRLDL